jgi:hypothetical protein
VLLVTYAALQVVAEAIDAERQPDRPGAPMPLLVLAALCLPATKVGLTTDAPRAVHDTYEQRYRAGRLLPCHCDGQPVATGELGHVSPVHRGQFADLPGLSNHEALRRRQATYEQPASTYRADMSRSRAVDVAAVYSSTRRDETP